MREARPVLEPEMLKLGVSWEDGSRLMERLDTMEEVPETGGLE